MNKKEEKFIRKQLLFTHIVVYFFFTLILFLSGLLLYSDGYFDRFFIETYDGNFLNVSVDFTELTEEEQAIAYSVLKKVKLIYLSKQKEVIFTKNLSKYYTGKDDVTKLFGYNTWDSKNYILYTGDVAQLRRTLCHELTHSFLKRSDDESHEIVYDLGRLGVCYK